MKQRARITTRARVQARAVRRGTYDGPEVGAAVVELALRGRERAGDAAHAVAGGRQLARHVQAAPLQVQRHELHRRRAAVARFLKDGLARKRLQVRSSRRTSLLFRVRQSSSHLGSS